LDRERQIQARIATANIGMKQQTEDLTPLLAGIGGMGIRQDAETLLSFCRV
jgi:hypothetical protein